ncbi:MAG: S41 family peptidase, partial [Opitutales bacterium]|nr:S41 family peptidase [Opitutales bacterium]
KKAGIKPDDVIVEVDDKSTQDWNVARAVKEMEGPEGAELKLKVYRRSTGELKTFTIKREKIQMHSIRGWRLDVDGNWDYYIDSSNHIGYMRISQFIDSTLDDFNKIVGEMLDTEIKALILDLRGNPGGLMFTATGIIDRLIPQGVILKTRGENSPEQTHNATADNTLPNFHLVVLIDKISASASEIVSGALRDHKRAIVIGERSWGKGSVQRTFKLSGNRGVVKLTTDYYYLPNGSCIHKLDGAETWGVEPDIEVEFDGENYKQLGDLMLKLQGRGDNGETDSNTAEDPAELCKQLLELDNQLKAAVDKCLELIKIEPGLQPLDDN